MFSLSVIVTVVATEAVAALPEYPDEEDFKDQYAYDEAVEIFYDKISEIKDNLILECKEELVNDDEGVQLDDMVFESSEKTEPK